MSVTLSEYIRHELKFLRLDFRIEYRQYQIFADLVEFVYRRADCENDFLNLRNIDMREFYELEAPKYELFKTTVASHSNNYLKWYMRDVIKSDKMLYRLRKYFGPYMQLKKGVYTLTPRNTACRIAQQIWRQRHGRIRDWYEVN